MALLFETEGSVRIFASGANLEAQGLAFSSPLSI